MVDHVGVILGLVVAVAATTLWLGVQVARRPAPPPQPAGEEAPADASPVGLRLLGTLLLFVVWQALALLLVLWALAAREVGPAAAAGLVLPALVGFGFAWRKGVLKW